MKKVMLCLFSAATLMNILPVNGTVSYLTSVKDYSAPISLGTNDDIFQTETKSLYLETKVKKNTSIKKEKQKDGKTKESKQEKTSVSLGSQVLVMIPQRQGLFLDKANFHVTGFPAGAIKVETVELANQPVDQQVFAFRVSHAIGAAYSKTYQQKGELQIEALGGFYHLSIPITLVNKYDEEVSVEEIEPPQDDVQPPANEPQPPETQTPPGNGGSNPKPEGTNKTTPEPAAPSVPEMPVSSQSSAVPEPVQAPSESAQSAQPSENHSALPAQSIVAGPAGQYEQPTERDK